MKSYEPLRLAAEDAGDLPALSAMLQDAVAKVGDFAHLPQERRFAFVANRFLWEDAAKRKRGPYGRVRTGVHFDDVLAVRAKAVRMDAKDAVVSVLAVRFEPGEDGAGTVTLDLAGGGAIALDVECLNVRLSDLTDPWAARGKPEHPED
ncbi:MAG: DUF2948 family protein [Pseudomonadota bacterium]